MVPSAVSAIKVNGKRAYDLARRGMEVKLKAREVEVTRLDVLASRPGEGVLDVDIDVECSSGTYVRAIARDLGKSLGVGGHLTALRRTRIGRYDLSVAVELGEDPPAMMSMADAAKRSLPCVTVDHGMAVDVGFGRRLDMTVPADVTGILKCHRICQGLARIKLNKVSISLSQCLKPSKILTMIGKVVVKIIKTILGKIP